MREVGQAYAWWQGVGPEMRAEVLPVSIPPTARRVLAVLAKAKGKDMDQSVLEELTEGAVAAAQQRGARAVAIKDINYALRGIREKEIKEELEERQGRPPPPPKLPPPPENRTVMLEYLDHLADIAKGLKERGIQPPKVGVMCERSAVLARLWKRAGADVLSCNLMPSEASEGEGIAHFVGDARYCTRKQLDMVVGFAPCTYVSLAAIRWADYADADGVPRSQRLQEACEFFLEIYDSDAAFVVMEWPHISPAAKAAIRGMTPRQCVQPWQMGQGEIKPVNLYTRGEVPLLQPTCVVAGRSKRMSSLPPSKWRSEWRSFYAL